VSIHRPIFILGSARSGTTILYNLLAAHADTCWVSYASDARPGQAGPVRRHRWLDLPLVGAGQRRAIVRNRPNRARMRWMPWPAEGDRTWHTWAGFGAEPYGTETRLDEAMESRLRGVMELHLDVTRRPRFLCKQTANNRRLELVDRMFPDALYVHLIRDGRAVANSMVREPWWNDMQVWWLGKRVREWDQGDPVALAALYWQRTLEEIRRHAPRFGDRYTEVHYEELAADTPRVIDGIARFAGLGTDATHAGMLPATLPNMNHKWRTKLTPTQQAGMLDAVGPALAELGYGPDDEGA
jgi:hypothetical protein